MRRATLGVMLALLLASCGTGPTPAPVQAVPGDVESGIWFVDVAQEGSVWLSPETLRALGLDPQAEAAPELRLSWSDDEIPYLPLSTEQGWGVLFYAPDRATRYTQQTSFRLEPGVAGPRMSSEEPPAPVGTPGAGLFSARWEQNRRYLPQATSPVPWFWEPLYAPGEIAHTVVLTSALPGPLTATLALWSHTSLSPTPDHRLRLQWDGETVGEWEWEGRGMQRLTATWDEAQPGGEHTLTIETPATSEGGGVAVVWIDGWELTYRRPADSGVYRAEGSSLAVAASGARVLDVTEPLAPVDLGIAEGEAGGTVAGRRYWVGIPEPPLTLRPASRVDLASLAGVTYLAIAPAAFQPALQPLLDYRQGEGLTTAAVAPQAIYDTFGGGRPNPDAIRALVQQLPDLRYLLLVGDASVEPGGYDGEAGALRVVTPFTRTTILGETPADALLGIDGEGRPAVAVGRFPVESDVEVAALVEKTIRWETGDTPPVPLLLNDDEPEFVALINEIAPLIPGGETAPRIDMGDAGSRDALLEALNRGPVWLNYNGHGSLARLGDEGILTVEDGVALKEPLLGV
ncbi:MAG: C25 family cysteine peptidase, partial [Chloroflexota bacterium]|nr:C25 family cysteine peptidase [Chloroflexota bacterium]